MGYSGYSSYYSNYPSSYGNVSAATATTLIGALMVWFVIVLAIAIVQIVAMWKLFTKAGEKGWKSIIPIYNLVILFKISGLSPWLLFVYFVAIIPFIGWIAPIALNAVLAYKLAKSFGKDAGWAVGIYFLAPIFYMILAFGKSQYVGPDGETKTVETTANTSEETTNTEAATSTENQE